MVSRNEKFLTPVCEIIPGHPWFLHLCCCGWDAGVRSFATWEEADAYRSEWERSGDHQHQRVAVLSDDLANAPWEISRKVGRGKWAVSKDSVAAISGEEK